MGDCLASDPDIFDHDGGPISRSIFVPAIVFVPVAEGLAVVHEESGRLVGGYIGMDLVIDPEWRRRGLGAETVLEYFLRNGELPNWHADKPSYSRGGYKAHQKAWEMALDLSIMEAKHDAITGAGEVIKMAKPIVPPDPASARRAPRYETAGAGPC